jgi:hypothetical protein
LPDNNLAWFRKRRKRGKEIREQGLEKMEREW